MTDRVPDPGAVIAVTGASGFLGSHICDALLARGHAVRAGVRPTSDLRWLRGKPIEVVPCDFAAAGAIDSLLGGCQGVIHCAGAIAAPDETAFRGANVDLTEVLLRGSERSGAVRSFVFISSLAAVGPGTPADPVTEATPPRPVTAYGRSKRDAEALVHDRPWPMRTATLRPPALYGPRDREFLPLFRAARRGLAGRLGRALAGISLVDGRDAAAAAVELLETRSATGPYLVDDGPGPQQREAVGRDFAWGHSWDELFAALEAAWQRRLRRVTVPLGVLRLLSALPAAGARRNPVVHPDRVRDLAAPGWVCSAARLRRDTRWLPRHDLATGFAETRAFLEREGWL